MPERWKFDAEALRRHLSTVVPELAGGFEVAKFTGGQSNPTYLIEAADRRFVLRRKPPGAVLHSAHAIDQGIAVLGAQTPTRTIQDGLAALVGLRLDLTAFGSRYPSEPVNS